MRVCVNMFGRNTSDCVIRDLVRIAGVISIFEGKDVRGHS